MNAALLALAVTACLTADEPMDTTPMRKPHPLAPSLPQLTADEEDKIDDVVNHFIQYDIGQLRGEEGRKTKKEFDALQPEAIPALIRGLNRAAKLEFSCPATVIAKKLNGMLMASDDAKLLEFARVRIRLFSKSAGANCPWSAQWSFATLRPCRLPLPSRLSTTITWGWSWARADATRERERPCRTPRPEPARRLSQRR